jgi:putative transcriptional regulator
MKICNNLKLWRIKTGDLTQDELAQKTGCSRQTINSIEKGKFNPSIELALKLADILRCNVGELFFLNKDDEV